jgi:hypothetical protein
VRDKFVVGPVRKLYASHVPTDLAS